MACTIFGDKKCRKKENRRQLENADGTSLFKGDTAVVTAYSDSSEFLNCNSLRLHSAMGIEIQRCSG